MNNWLVLKSIKTTENQEQAEGRSQAYRGRNTVSAPVCAGALPNGFDFAAGEGTV